MCLCLSSSSDEHHDVLGTCMRVGIQNAFVIIVHLWTQASATFSVCGHSRPRHFLVGLFVKRSLYPCADYFVNESETGDPQMVAEPGGFGQDPPPSFSAPTLPYTHRQGKRDLRLLQATSSLQKNRQEGWLLRQLKGESWTAAEVVMDDALVQDDGIDLVVQELDRCWGVTQDQDKASKIEKALFETQRDAKTEITFMSCVARRKLKLKQLENALGTSPPVVIKDHATLRDANHRRQLRQGGVVDGWQLRLRRRRACAGAVGPP